MRIHVVLIVCVGLLFASCSKNRLNVDVAGIETSVHFQRYDKEFFGRDTASLFRELDNLRAADSTYFDIYTGGLLNIGMPGDEGFNEYLGVFLTDSVFRRVADSVLFLFNDLSAIEKQVNKGFKHYLYHYSNGYIPKLYAQFTGFNQPVVISDSAIGVSLENYMGPNCVFYQYLGIPEYKRAVMYPNKMVADIFYALGASLHPYKAVSNNLLSNMMYEGKLLYFAEAMCRNLPDTVLVGYSKEKLRWCRANEAMMWAYLIEHKMLYNTDRLMLRKFLGDAPFTNDFTSESPGRAVAWIGWQIVRSYMNKNQHITLPEMMQMNNYQEMLSQSGYHPE
jgi:hypothetical protein